MTSTTKIVLGILGAAAAGVVVGMLIAPEKGSDLRDRIRSKAEGWADEVSHLFSREKEDLKEKAKEVKSVVESRAGKLEENLS